MPQLPPILAAWHEWTSLLIILLGCYVLGRTILSRLVPIDEDPIERFVLSTGLGLGLLSYAILALGAAGLLYRSVFIGLLALLALAALSLLRSLRSSLPAAPTIQPIEAICGLLILFAWYATLCAALVPPVYYDIVLYHYAAPSIYLMNHQMVYLPDMLHSNYPFTLEMLFMMGLSLKGWKLANLINASFGILAGLGVYRLGALSAGRTAGLLAMTAFCCSASVMELSVIATTDIGVTGFHVLASICLLRWLLGKNPRWSVPAALFMGLCMGTKYTAILMCFVTSLVVLVALTFARSNRDHLSPRILLRYIILAVITFSPWAIRNLLTTGNPLYPFFHPIFGGPDITREHFDLIFLEGKHIALTFSNLPELLLTPVHLLYRYQQTGLASALGYVFSFFVPIACLLPRKPPAVKILLSFAAVYLVFWTLSSNMVRFLLPALPLFAVTVGFAIERIATWNAITAWLARSLGILAVTSGLVIFTTLNFMTRDQFHAGMGLMTEREFLDRYYPLRDTIEFVNAHLPARSRLILFGETRSFYFERRTISSTAHDDHPLEQLVRRSTTVDSVAAGLAALGATHIAVSPGELNRLDAEYDWLKWTEEDHRRFNDYLIQRTRIIHAGKSERIHEITEDTGTQGAG